MRLKKVLAAVFVGYFTLGVSLAAIWAAVVFWPFGDAFQFLEDDASALTVWFVCVPISLSVSVCLVMGATLGWLWDGLPPAFDENLSNFLLAPLIFCAPLLLFPAALVFIIFLLPVIAFLMGRGFDFGIRLRRSRLSDEFLDRWSPGEFE